MLIKLLKHSRLSIGNNKFIDLSIVYNKSSYIAIILHCMLCIRSVLEDQEIYNIFNIKYLVSCVVPLLFYFSSTKFNFWKH